MNKPVDLNELQVIRVMELWHEFMQEPINRDLVDEFINWLECGKPKDRR